MEFGRFDAELRSGAEKLIERRRAEAVGDQADLPEVSERDEVAAVRAAYDAARTRQRVIG